MGGGSSKSFVVSGHTEKQVNIAVNQALGVFNKVLHGGPFKSNGGTYTMGSFLKVIVRGSSGDDVKVSVSSKDADSKLTSMYSKDKMVAKKEKIVDTVIATIQDCLDNKLTSDSEKVANKRLGMYDLA